VSWSQSQLSEGQSFADFVSANLAYGADPADPTTSSQSAAFASDFSNVSYLVSPGGVPLAPYEPHDAYTRGAPAPACNSQRAETARNIHTLADLSTGEIGGRGQGGGAGRGACSAVHSQPGSVCRGCGGSRARLPAVGARPPPPPPPRAAVPHPHRRRRVQSPC